MAVLKENHKIEKNQKRYTYQLSNLVEHKINNSFSDSVVPASIVVCSVFFASY